MAYRQFSTATWQDPWFEKLNQKAKLLFIYLWTNEVCNQAGLYQISQRRVEFETGLKVPEVIPELEPKIVWYPEHEIVWVKNFFKWQCQNPKFAISAIRALYCIPQKIVDQFTQHNAVLIEKYGIDTLSIPYQTGNDTVSLSVTVTKQKQNRNSNSVSDTVSEFDDFWKCYPKKVGKVEAKKAWARANGTRPPTEQIIAKINQLKKSKQWTKDGGDYIPNPATWLNRGGWDDECKAEVASCKAPTWDDYEQHKP